MQFATKLFELGIKSTGKRAFPILTLIMLIIFAFSPQVSNAQQTKYTITTVTGKKGTDADIIIRLYGTHGEMTSWSLPLDDKKKNDFWPGATDVFYIWENQDLGIITDIELKGKGPGLSVDPWQMVSLTVSSDGPKGRDKNGQAHVSKFVYKDGKSWIDQDDLNARYPQFRSLMLSDVQYNTDGKWAGFNKWVEVNEFWVSKGGLYTNGDKGAIDNSTYNSSTAGSSSRDNTSVENEATLSIEHEPPAGPKIQVSYRLKVANEIERMKSAERTSGSSFSDPIAYDVPANSIEFIHVSEQEKRVGGYFENNTANRTLDDKRRWIVMGQRWVAQERLMFKYVDQVVGGYKFEDLYKKAFPGAAVPTSPKTPTAPPPPPVVAQPVVTPPPVNTPPVNTPPVNTPPVNTPPVNTQPVVTSPPVTPSTTTTNVTNNNTTTEVNTTNNTANTTNNTSNTENTNNTTNTNNTANTTNNNSISNESNNTSNTENTSNTSNTENTTINISNDAGSVIWEDLIYSEFEREPYENGSHAGYIEECPVNEGQLTWINDDDEMWNLIPDFANNRLILSDENSPYKGNADAKYFNLYIEDGIVYAFEFMGDIYYLLED